MVSLTLLTSRNLFICMYVCTALLEVKPRVPSRMRRRVLYCYVTLSAPKFFQLSFLFFVKATTTCITRSSCLIRRRYGRWGLQPEIQKTCNVPAPAGVSLHPVKRPSCWARALLYSESPRPIVIPLWYIPTFLLSEDSPYVWMQTLEQGIQWNFTAELSSWNEVLFKSLYEESLTCYSEF